MSRLSKKSYALALSIAALVILVLAIPSDFSRLVQQKQERGENVFISRALEVPILNLNSGPVSVDLLSFLRDANDGSVQNLDQVISWLESDTHYPERSLFVRLLSSDLIAQDLAQEYLNRINSYVYTGLESGGYNFFNVTTNLRLILHCGKACNQGFLNLIQENLFQKQVPQLKS